VSWFGRSTPRRAEGGLEARSRRGDIGEEWWSKRFVDVLESYARANRLQRGKRYARKGQVLELTVSPGEVEAEVQGSRPSPYVVTIGGDALTEREWKAVEEAMLERASFTATLLAGDMPADVEEAFEAADTSLFPDDLEDVHTACTCPDAANPCKHLAAVFYILAEKFDDDPFLIFRWRGRTRETLLEHLRRSHASHGGSNAEGRPLGDCLEKFWTTESDLASPPPELSNPRSQPTPSVLRRLGEPPHELAEVVDPLRSLYADLD
jgi:uncharacterized Zn finger protein